MVTLAMLVTNISHTKLAKTRQIIGREAYRSYNITNRRIAANGELFANFEKMYNVRYRFRDTSYMIHFTH